MREALRIHYLHVHKYLHNILRLCVREILAGKHLQFPFASFFIHLAAGIDKSRASEQASKEANV